MRIAKYLAAAGVCSRREAEVFIERGRVKLNGSVVNTPVTFIKEDDVVTFDNRTVRLLSEKKVWAFYKPIGCLTSKGDPEGRKTIYDVLPPSFANVKYVGRLDYASEGLLLMTNDGALVRALELPKHKIPRTYKVRVFGDVPSDMISSLEAGVCIDGVEYQPVKVNVQKSDGKNTWLMMTLFEGKNREIRNMMSFFDLKVNKLVRQSYGPVSLERLKPGMFYEVKLSDLMSYLKEQNADYQG